MPSLQQQITRGWQRPRMLNRLLYPLSAVYGALMEARCAAYRLGIFRRHKLPVPLIVIGNLSVGGSGKTPLLIALAAGLKQLGHRPGVITRGYGGGGPWPCEVLDDTDAAAAGDEAVLIYRRAKVPVVADANRRRAAQQLLGRCDVLLSDDGFQHLQLARDIDIVVIDGMRRFGNGWCLPAGPLRERPSAIARADFVVINGDGKGDEWVMKTRIEHAVRLRGGGIEALHAFAGRLVYAAAGLGNPDRFFAQLSAAGLQVQAFAFPDHHVFDEGDFAFANHDAPIFITEKDAVKCEALSAKLAARIWVVPLHTALPAELLAAVCERLNQ